MNTVLSYKNIMHTGNTLGVEYISAIAVREDGSEQPVILRKTEYELNIFLKSLKDKYGIVQPDIDNLINLLEQDSYQQSLESCIE